LIDFVVFLVPKLWLNIQKLIREIPQLPVGSPSCFCVFLHNFGTINARKSIKDSKDSYYSLESKQTLSHNIGSLSGRWRHKR